MIPAKFTPWEPDVWRTQLKSACRDSADLLRRLGLDPGAGLEHPTFPTLVPPGYIARMQPQDPDDPLLLQVLSRAAEQVQVPGYTADALQESSATPDRLPAGLLQKYHGRALLIATGACAVHCRYCFRRHFPYTEHRGDQFTEALQHIAADPSITELILSGGDPLMLSDRALANLLQRIDAIDHIQRVRIHTRLPVVLPERATAGLMAALADCRAQVVVVTHFNHPNELDAHTSRCLACLRSVCAQVLNQTVLLAGINDRAEVQIDLAQELFRQGVLPYYLHMPDKVAGTAHFDLDGDQAIALHQAMQAALPGYLVPRLVREVPGEPAKQIVRG